MRFDLLVALLVICVGVVILLSCFNSLVKQCHKCIRKLRRHRNRSRVESSVGRCNPDYVNTDDTPSVNNTDDAPPNTGDPPPNTDDRDTSFITEVQIVHENSITESQRSSDTNLHISDILPTYEEFMQNKNRRKYQDQEEKSEERENTADQSRRVSSLSATDSIEVESQAEASEVGDTEHNNCPPPPYEFHNQT